MTTGAGTAGTRSSFSHCTGASRASAASVSHAQYRHRALYRFSNAGRSKRKTSASAPTMTLHFSVSRKISMSFPLRDVGDVAGGAVAVIHHHNKIIECLVLLIAHGFNAESEQAVIDLLAG